jgi:hypothetical protein
MKYSLSLFKQDRMVKFYERSIIDWAEKTG